MPDFGGNFGQIFAILLWNQQVINIGVMRGQHLLFETAYGQYAPAQGNFAGHGHIGAHRTPGESGNHGGGNGDTCRRAIFRLRVFRHVNMQVDAISKIRVKPQLFGARANIGERGIHRFLHYIALLAGDEELAFALHGRHLDGEKHPAYFGHGQPHRDANLHFAANGHFAIARLTKILFQAVIGQANMGIGLLDYAPRHFAANGRKLPFQAAYTGFARVARHDLLHDRLRNLQLLLREAVFGQHFGQQVTQPDIHLLLKHVTGKVDDIHAVGQRARDLVFHVACADEEHLRQIKRRFQVLVNEGAVLLRIEHFKQRG